tara:strand:+ start:9170 stop:10084 length:915 start_codon:yes stop_codon:yes gene_type:complete
MLGLPLTLLFSLVLFSACGDNTNTLQTDESQAALAADEVIMAVGVPMGMLAQSAQDTADKESSSGSPQLPGTPPNTNEPLTKNQTQEIADDLEKQIEQYSGGSDCISTSVPEKNTFTLSFTQCTIGTNKTFTINGTIEATIKTDLAARKVTLSLTFKQLKSNDTEVNGTLQLVVSMSKASEVSFSTQGDFTMKTKDGNVNKLNLSGTTTLDKETKTAMISGTGTLEYNGTSYQIEVIDVKVVGTDGAPSGGSVKLTYTADGKSKTVEIIFDSNTPSTGEFEVKINGRSLGSFTAEALAQLLGGK